MKRNYIFTVLLLFVISYPAGIFSQVERKEQGNLITENIPEIPKELIERMQQYQNTRSASIQDWEREGKGIFISTRFAEVAQIHYVEKPGGARRQITFFSEPVSGAAVCPDPNVNGFIFSKDVGGGEFYQIYFYDLNAGQYKLLTDGKSRNQSPDWSNKGDKFVYSSTKRNGRDYDIYLSDIKSPQNAQLIMQNEGYWVAVDWSPSDDKLLVINYISANESYYYTFDINSSSLVQLNPSKEKIAYGGALWSKDGKGVYLTSDQNSEFRTLKYYNLTKKEFQDLTAWLPWDVESFQLSKSGDKLAFTTNEDGMNKLYLMDTKTKKAEQVKNLPVGLIYGLNFHPGGDQLAMVINTPQTPGDVFVMNLRNFNLERWTYSEVGGLNTENFVTPELFRYETFDKVDGKPRTIPAFIYKPKSVENRVPVLIDIHGGPEGQFNPYFSSLHQFLVNELGIAVIAPNVRGSSGYGKTYLRLDNGFKREESVKDIGSLLNWIEKQPELDPSRVAVYGGSYGGYMVLASMIHFNDRLKCGVDVVGISNFVTFLENTQEYRRDLRRVEYGDERDPEMRDFLTAISPTTNANKITKPIYIAQGLNDPRVPASEAEQILTAVRKNNVNAWYMLAKDEGHGFSKKTNRDFFIHSFVMFLQENLMK